MFLQEDFDKQ